MNAPRFHCCCLEQDAGKRRLRKSAIREDPALRRSCRHATSLKQAELESDRQEQTLVSANKVTQAVAAGLGWIRVYCGLPDSIQFRKSFRKNLCVRISPW